eukprot:362671-Chlamydomonas_euryale.AAC.6
MPSMQSRTTNGHATRRRPSMHRQMRTATSHPEAQHANTQKERHPNALQAQHAKVIGKRTHHALQSSTQMRIGKASWRPQAQARKALPGTAAQHGKADKEMACNAPWARQLRLDRVKLALLLLQLHTP